MINITKASFVKSSASLSQCPVDSRWDYAFIGRSNVGKSSLINMLCNRSDVAKVSATPGKTQLINHFLINDCLFIVDLPGYGYAKVSKDQKNKFQKLITEYVLGSERLAVLFVLIDSRHEPQRIDIEFMRMLGENGVPFAMIFTKADKLSPAKLAENIEHYTFKMLEAWEEMPPYFVTSSERRTGREEVLSYIEQVNNDLNSH